MKFERVNHVCVCVSAVMNGRVLQDVSGPAAAMMAEQTVLMKTDCEAEVQQQQRLEAIFHLSITLSPVHKHSAGSAAHSASSFVSLLFPSRQSKMLAQNQRYFKFGRFICIKSTILQFTSHHVQITRMRSDCNVGR